MRADKIIVLSGYLKRIFDEFNIPCLVIPNIIQLNHIQQSIDKKVINPHFISVRHLEPLYNIPCILRAFKIIQGRFHNASLEILGKGSQRNYLEKIVTDLDLNNVTFVGQIPNSEVNDYLMRNDILLSSPVIDNMPVSILEAFNCGLLVISSDVGGVPYIVENKKTGLLFNSDDHVQMAECAIWALTHQQESINIINLAKQEVSKYQWETIRNNIMKLYLDK